MIMNDFIKEHTESAQINLGVYGTAFTLACKRCGCMVWDVTQHMQYSHGITYEEGENEKH